MASESDAYHLLFQGDSNRHFERLPANAETSRGHTFFNVSIEHLREGWQRTLSAAGGWHGAPWRAAPCSARVSTHSMVWISVASCMYGVCHGIFD